MSPEVAARVLPKIAAAYNDGNSIRIIAARTGRSYGFTHRLLSECPDVTLRGRGGDNRTRTKKRAT
ncbi:helix-turn-helix domain-containing protein [Streptomyces qinzhouensis]|uniref:helix-turn-helix domain-containing protein n=1 Tax=Streptomyces qinzhouensis TaxID=2599401 RepID=UPI001FE5564E|nr:helix-turn-helix domain-containing protein [Streptomyces qinzhouensis]